MLSHWSALKLKLLALYSTTTARQVSWAKCSWWQHPLQSRRVQTSTTLILSLAILQISLQLLWTKWFDLVKRKRQGSNTGELCPWTCSSQEPYAAAAKSLMSRATPADGPSFRHPAPTSPSEAPPPGRTGIYAGTVSPIQPHGRGTMSNLAVPRLFTEWMPDSQGRFCYHSCISHLC